jgi:hypothetical protein
MSIELATFSVHTSTHHPKHSANRGFGALDVRDGAPGNPGPSGASFATGPSPCV